MSDVKKKLFCVSFVDYSDKDMYVMATSFDAAADLAMMVRREMLLQQEEQEKEDTPVLDKDGSLNTDDKKEDIFTILGSKRKNDPEINRVAIVTNIVYGLEDDDV